MKDKIKTFPDIHKTRMFTCVLSVKNNFTALYPNKIYSQRNPQNAGRLKI